MTDALAQARSALGAQLRELRKAKGLTGKELAARCGWHATKVSHLEHGRRAPSEPDLVTWTRVCDAPLVLNDLVATVRNLRAMYVEWTRLVRHGHSHGQRQAAQTASEANQIRWYEPELVPGLLQTADYARAVFLGCRTVLPVVVDDVDQAVELRLRQRELLTKGRRRLSILIHESALWRTVGDAAVMLEQLRQLAADAASPRLSLGIVPLTAVWPCPAHGFVLYDNTSVAVETVSAELAVTRPSEVAIYAETYRRLHDTAIHGVDALDLLARIHDGRTLDAATAESQDFNRLPS